MAKVDELYNYFHKRKVELYRKGVEIKTVYISEHIFMELLDDPESGISFENRSSFNYKDYTFRGVPVVMVLSEDHFGIGV